jgi:hypothetical protein
MPLISHVVEMPTLKSLTSVDPGLAQPVQALPVRDVKWVVRRALFGLTLLLSLSVGAAMLLDATIDPALNEAASE